MSEEQQPMKPKLKSDIKKKKKSLWLFKNVFATSPHEFTAPRIYTKAGMKKKRDSIKIDERGTREWIKGVYDETGTTCWSIDNYNHLLYFFKAKVDYFSDEEEEVENNKNKNE